MKAESALHLLMLGACFVVQSGGLDLAEMPGVGALQAMEARGAIVNGMEATTSPQRVIYTVVLPTIILELIDRNRLLS